MLGKVKKIVVPVYFSTDDNGKILIDTDEITNEFETQLKRITDTGNVYEE